MAIKPVVCGGTEVYVPECDPCDMFEERVEALEECCDEAQATLADHEQRITTNEADIASIKQNFANYYTKAETYSKNEVNNLIEQIETVTIVRVTELPATGENNKIYLVPKSGSSPDVHDEYIWSNNAWEKIGDTQIDLSNYYTKLQVDGLLDTKQNTLNAGTNVQINGNTISATDTKYTAGTNVQIAGTTISATDTKYTATKENIGSSSGWNAGTLPTLGTAIPADDITAWNAGTLPTLGTAIPADDITAWNAGTLPTLGTAIPADDITAWNAGTAATSTVSNGVLTLNDGTAPSLSYSAKSIPNVTGVGTLPSLSYTAKSIPNVTGVGTLPSLTYSAKSIPNVTGVGTLPTLTVTSKSVVTDISES